jgi:hypothetical protein
MVVPLEVCNLAGTLVYSYGAPVPAPAWRHTKATNLANGDGFDHVSPTTRKGLCWNLDGHDNKVAIQYPDPCFAAVPKEYALTTDVSLCFDSILVDNLRTNSCRGERRRRRVVSLRGKRLPCGAADGLPRGWRAGMWSD